MYHAFTSRIKNYSISLFYELTIADPIHHCWTLLVGPAIMLIVVFVTIMNQGLTCFVVFSTLLLLPQFNSSTWHIRKARSGQAPPLVEIPRQIMVPTPIILYQEHETWSSAWRKRRADGWTRHFPSSTKKPKKQNQATQSKLGNANQTTEPDNYSYRN